MSGAPWRSMAIVNPYQGRPVEHCTEVVLSRPPYREALALASEIRSGSSRQEYPRSVTRSLLQRIHNPRNRECGCDPDCWCRRTALGRAVKWWLPTGMATHKNDALAAW